MSIEQLQQLRSQTGAGILDVKKALEETSGDYDKALELLRKRGEAVALKKSTREAHEGIISSYVHMDRIGVLVELNCETDFVARTDEFKELAKDIALQIASMNPQYVSSDQISDEVKEKEREIYRAQIDTSKPDDVKEKIVEGKLKKFYEESCLLEQKFFKNDDMTIQDVLHEAIGKLGENVQVRRFVRFSLDDREAPQAC